VFRYRAGTGDCNPHGAWATRQRVLWTTLRNALGLAVVGIAAGLAGLRRAYSVSQQPALRHKAAGCPCDCRRGAGARGLRSGGWIHSRVASRFNRSYARFENGVDNAVRDCLSSIAMSAIGNSAALELSAILRGMRIPAAPTLRLLVALVICLLAGGPVAGGDCGCGTHSIVGHDSHPGAG